MPFTTPQFEQGRRQPYQPQIALAICTFLYYLRVIKPQGPADVVWERIDRMLVSAGWLRDAKKIGLYEKQGVAIFEFELKSGFDTDHLLWRKDDSLEASDDPDPNVIQGISCNYRLRISD